MSSEEEILVLGQIAACCDLWASKKEVPLEAKREFIALAEGYRELQFNTERQSWPANTLTTVQSAE